MQAASRMSPFSVRLSSTDSPISIFHSFSTYPKILSAAHVMSTASRKDGKAFTYPEHRMLLIIILPIILRTSHPYLPTRRS